MVIKPVSTEAGCDLYFMTYEQIRSQIRTVKAYHDQIIRVLEKWEEATSSSLVKQDFISLSSDFAALSLMVGDEDIGANPILFSKLEETVKNLIKKSRHDAVFIQHVLEQILKSVENEAFHVRVREIANKNSVPLIRPLELTIPLYFPIKSRRPISQGFTKAFAKEDWLHQPAALDDLVRRVTAAYNVKEGIADSDFYSINQADFIFGQGVELLKQIKAAHPSAERAIETAIRRRSESDAASILLRQTLGLTP